jgi:hypothetical protein
LLQNAHSFADHFLQMSFSKVHSSKKNYSRQNEGVHTICDTFLRLNEILPKELQLTHPTGRTGRASGISLLVNNGAPLEVVQLESHHQNVNALLGYREPSTAAKLQASQIQQAMRNGTYTGNPQQPFPSSFTTATASLQQQIPMNSCTTTTPAPSPSILPSTSTVPFVPPLALLSATATPPPAVTGAGSASTVDDVPPEAWLAVLQAARLHYAKKTL